jgi:hypothetical protein
MTRVFHSPVLWVGKVGRPLLAAPRFFLNPEQSTLTPH